MIRTLFAAAASAALLAGAANAAPVTFALDGVVLSDGTEATGSFVFDPETGTFGGVSITTMDGADGTGATYTVASEGTGDTGSGPGGDFQFFEFQTGAGLDGPGDRGIEFVVFDMVDDMGGSFALQFVGEFVCETEGCTAASEFRSGTQGAFVSDGVAPVPLPAAALLFPVGLAGLAAARRRA